MHPLDNVIWTALTTRQLNFAEGSGLARRFLKEVTLLSGFERPDDHGYGSLAEVVGEGGTAAVFLDHPYEPREGWDWIAGAPLLQMVCENVSDAAGATSSPSNSRPGMVELGVLDSPEMIELTTLTKPGPFRSANSRIGHLRRNSQRSKARSDGR